MQRVAILSLKPASLDSSTTPTVFTPAAMIFFAVCGAALTGASGLVRLPLPFTPIPVTGQVLAVLVCGALLGSGYGLLSQALFVAAGIAGLPWLAGGKVGMAAMLAPTAGYMIGFLAAAYFLGACSRFSGKAHTFQGQVKLMLAAVGIIYFCGASWLMLTGMSPVHAFVAGVLPFIAGDMLKVMLAAKLTSAILPRQAK